MKPRKPATVPVCVAVPRRLAAINSGRGHGKDEAAILIGIAGQNCLPLILAAAIIDAPMFVAARHVACSGQFEYRIGCHNAPSLTLDAGVGYPDLAVKLISLVIPKRDETYTGF